MVEAGATEPSDGSPETEATAERLNWTKRTGPQVLLALTGFVIVIVAAMLVNTQLSRKLGGHFAPMLDGVLHLKQAIVTSHLWLEEHLVNNDTEGLRDVLRQLDLAESYAVRVLDGEAVHLLELAGKPEDKLKKNWQLLYEKIHDLKKIIKLRIERRTDTEGRLAIARRYDESVRDTLASANHLEASLEHRITGNLASLQHIQFVVIGVCLLLLGSGAWFINKNVRLLAQEVRHRRAAEKNLERSRAEAVVARDEARAASVMKDQLLGKVSHEVRTPVNAILGMATVLESTHLDAAQRGYVELLESETRSLLRIMDDLSDFTKLESSKIRIHAKPFDLRRVVADTVDLLIPEAIAKDITLDADLPAAFPHRLIGDCVRIRQVLLNLLNNAVKFTDQGHVVAELRASQRDDGRYDVTLAVEDTGIGVPQDKREHIFRPFAQGDDSMARRFGGTGLGLAICKELAALMHGTIGVDSLAGGGTRFWFRLPMAPAEAGGEAVLPLEQLTDCRVLVIDLDDEVRQRTCHLLQQLGAVPVPIANASGAPDALLEALETGRPYHAVLVNERLSETALWQLTAQVGLTERIADTAILVLVKNAARVDMISKYNTGVTACVSSPHRVLELPALLLGQAPRGIPRPTAPCSGDATAATFDLDVLLVEDHPVTQIAGRHILETLGCRVNAARDGHDGLAQWRAKRFDAIFLDWQLPGMDGLEVAAQIREQEQRLDRPRTYLVAMTANAMAGDRERCLNAGMDEYISKPVTTASFICALSRFAPVRMTTPAPADDEPVRQP